MSALSDAVAAGASASAGRLEELTHRPWTVKGVTESRDEAGPFADQLSSVALDVYGVELAFPGGSFLVLFSNKSGYLVASAFTRPVHERVEPLPKREALALGEACNILLNPLVGALAETLGKALIVGAPKTGIASRRDHLSRALKRYRGGERLAASYFARLASAELGADCDLLVFLDRALVEKAGGPKTPPA